MTLEECKLTSDGFITAALPGSWTRSVSVSGETAPSSGSAVDYSIYSEGQKFLLLQHVSHAHIRTSLTESDITNGTAFELFLPFTAELSVYA